MYHLFKAPIGKVMFIISDKHKAYPVFKKSKVLVYSGSLQECEDHHANLYPGHPMNHLK
jgi:hypothetical protein